MKKKVSYSKFPFLKSTKSEKFLKNIISETEREGVYRGDLKHLDFLRILKEGIGDDDKLLNVLIGIDDTSLYQRLQRCKSNISYFTPSFMDAIFDSRECLIQTLKDKVKDSDNKDLLVPFFDLLNIKTPEDTRSGIIIFNNEGYPTGHTYFTYNLGFDKLSKDRIIEIVGIVEAFSSKSKNTPRKSAHLFTYSYTRELIPFGERGIRAHCYKEGPKACPGVHEGIENNILWLINTLLFKEIARTELEIIDIVDDSKLPKGLSSLQKQCKLNSLEGDIEINYYDARWYTEIIRNEGFSVRGHWRNQPYKDGYKLIFIKPFEKKGYHRRAEKDIPIKKG